jgi:hypothetical protein
MIRYINILFFAVMIVMNYMANALPLNNKTTGELSNSFPNLFVPAGITFSIWGIIYLLLLIFTIVQFTSTDKTTIYNIGWLYAISCLFNALWIIAWHYGKLPMSLIIMVGLLISLIYINMTISHLPMGIIKAAFGVYLGWICIATIANVTALLVNYNWNGFGISHETWTIIMISSGAIITVLALYKFDNPYIGLVVMWAFAGIIIKRTDDFRSIVIAASVGIAVLGVVTILVFFRKKSGIV